MLYLKLYEEIKKRILQGALPPGSQLPSKRQMARDRGLSLNTVTKSLDQLIAEGYVEAIERQGYFVLNQKLSLHEPEQWPAIETTEEAPQVDWRYQGVDADFPATTWKRLTIEAINDDRRILTERGPKMGEVTLREAITNYLWTTKGIQVPSSHIIISSSTENLLLLLVQLLEKRRIGVEDPGFHRWGEFLTANHIQQVPIALDEEGACPLPHQLKQIDALYLTPSYQFPTGKILSIGRRQTLLEWANQYNKWLIEDEYNGEFRFEGQPVPPLKTIDQHDRVIYLQSFSALISPAIRISFMVLPDALMQKFIKFPYYFSCPVPRLSQHSLARFMAGGHFTRHVNRMRRVYHKKRQFLEDWVRHYPQLQIQGTNAGLHLLLVYPNSLLSEQELLQVAVEKGMALSPLSDYQILTQPGPPSFVVGYGRPSLDDLTKGTQILEKVWELHSSPEKTAPQSSTHPT